MQIFKIFKKTTGCPFCYREIDLQETAFQCSGHGKPGLSRCEEEPDQLRVQEFGDTTPVRPAITKKNSDEVLLGHNKMTCPNCGAQSGIRLCPHCHSPLPRSLQADSPMFGLVGVRNSGKTVYLSVLHNELVRNIARRFNASIDTPGGNRGYTQQLLLNSSNMGGANAQLPAQTAARGNRNAEPAIYEWKYNDGKRLRSTVFSFYDSAGEDLADRAGVESQQYLKSVNGIILMLDPFTFQENLTDGIQKKALAGGTSDLKNLTTPETVIGNLIEVIRDSQGLKPNKKIKIPIAIVVAKIDAFFDDLPESSPIRRRSPDGQVFDEQDSLDVHNHMASLMQKWGADNLVRRVDTEFETYRFFGVSALGAEPDYTSLSVNPRGLLPHRVADPILWLLAERGFIPKSEVEK
ncbi:zinc ribbon domain-containing protein [Corynebacterium glucuronolyticum]|uniref:Double-GTPase 2 domain-containing protein n=2 Tax=Corynebacterium glucuronolyticum TaxID=39791 RepID=A0AAX1L8H8_9CORY|nr:zinc ribbon domain-containing protein [Corynebacterium glucuronolyticum]QQU88563.1 hypothetical protein I6I68_00720 [Corynebacterium glucuronolyticum]QRP70565.1 hypothetical protein I6J21_12665 [Corynebacterium glucuronolyticum]